MKPACTASSAGSVKSFDQDAGTPPGADRLGDVCDVHRERGGCAGVLGPGGSRWCRVRRQSPDHRARQLAEGDQRGRCDIKASLKPAQYYQGSIFAWNAHREGRASKHQARRKERICSRRRLTEGPANPAGSKRSGPVDARTSMRPWPQRKPKEILPWLKITIPNPPVRRHYDRGILWAALTTGRGLTRRRANTTCQASGFCLSLLTRRLNRTRRAGTCWRCCSAHH